MKPAVPHLFRAAPPRHQIVEPSPDRPDEQPLIGSSLPPSRAQKRLAFAVVLVLLLAFLVTAGPLSAFHLPRVDAFVPAYGTAIFVNDAVTAALLFAQFSIVRARALLLIACGYLFTALIVMPWMLTSPGIFAPGGLLGAGMQSTGWLYVMWHAGFSLFVIAYALLNRTDTAGRPSRAPPFAGPLAGLAVIGAVIAVTILATRFGTSLPSLLRDEIDLSGTWQYAAAATALTSLTALATLWLRRRSVLDLWLMVVMCAYVIEIVLISFPVPARFTVGWYGGLVFGLLSASIVLIVLLIEITALYARLLNALLAQRREREARLLTGNAVAAMIAHEIKQPLTGITARAQAGLRWLDRPAPELDEAREAFRKIAANGLLTGKVIDSVRTVFRGHAQSRIALDPDLLIADVLACLRADLQRHRIFVHTEPEPDMPAIAGDPTQLRQVLVNLVTNAIDAMAESTGPRILSVCTTLRDGSVRISVADTGPGIPPEDADRIFNPVFTTKAYGVGMGLAICRSIIENHDGHLWIVPNTPQGAVFHVALPAAGAGAG
jgi:signal transduction histidine kinase